MRHNNSNEHGFHAKYDIMSDMVEKGTHFLTITKVMIAVCTHFSTITKVMLPEWIQFATKCQVMLPAHQYSRGNTACDCRNFTTIESIFRREPGFRDSLLNNLPERILGYDTVKQFILPAFF
jgi:hypothetical protein